MQKAYKKVIKECIKELKSENKEQIWLMLKTFIDAYISSLIIFGNNYITQDAYNIWKQIKQITQEEARIHRFLLKNVKDIDFNKCIELFDLLEDINTQTIIYYLNAFDDIKSACETKNELYAKHRKKNFQTLVETDEYKIISAGLTIKIEDIKNFLNFNEDFWKYIKPRIKYIEGTKENEFFYCTLMKFDKNNHLIDLKVIIPHIVDLKTALVNIHELKHAYDLYQLLEKEVDENNPIYEQAAAEKENEFKTQYVLKRFNR